MPEPEPSYLDLVNAWLAGGAIGPPPVRPGGAGPTAQFEPSRDRSIFGLGPAGNPTPGELRRLPLEGGWSAIQQWDGREWRTLRTQPPERQPRDFDPFRASPEERERDRQYREQRDSELRREREEQRTYERERQVALDGEREHKRQADEARDQRDFEASERWKQAAAADRQRVDKLDREWAAKLQQYKQDRDAIDDAYRKSIAVGEFDGQPTLAGRDQALRERQYQDQLANMPRNFYNYIFRSAGIEPPPLPGRPAALAATTAPAIPPGYTVPGERHIEDWRNYDVPGLKARFSATELARLPLEALADFSNEDLLTIGAQYPGGVDAFLRLFPRERIEGSGRWGGRGTGFGLDVQQRLYPGQPSASPTASLQGVTPSNQTPSLPGAPTATPPATEQDAIALADIVKRERERQGAYAQQTIS